MTARRKAKEILDYLLAVLNAPELPKDTRREIEREIVFMLEND